MSARRGSQKTVLALTRLEERDVPAAWPFPNQTQGVIINTYGQYQENRLLPEEVAALRPAVAAGTVVEVGHVHEGLDIAAPAGTPVRAVAAGVIEAVHFDNGTPYHSVIVIRDVATNADGTPQLNGGLPVLGGRGWNYKHVVPDPSLVVGRVVQAGQLLGMVADLLPTLVGRYQSHLHLDRGEADNRKLGPEQFRDQSIRSLINFRNAQRAAQSADPQTRAFGNSLLRAFQVMYRPTINPLTEFVNDPRVVDEIRPTVSKIDFRINLDNGTGALFNNGQLERVRNTPRYFQQTQTVRGETYRRLGRLATSEPVEPNNRTRPLGPNSGPDNYDNTQIDFVVSSFDRTGPQGSPNAPLLAPYSFTLQVNGRGGPTAGVESGVVQSLDFDHTKTPTGVGSFANLPITRTIYENDKAHNTVWVPTDPGGDPLNPFWFILTNTRNANDPPSKQPGIGSGFSLQTVNRESSWNTLARRPAADNNFADPPFSGGLNASKMSEALYPDGLYDIRVTAYDLQENNGVKIEKVLLNNWTQKLDLNNVIYTPNDLVSVAGGENFVPGSAVDLYLVPNRLAMESTDLLSAADMRVTVTANPDGTLPAVNIGNLPEGNYCLVADYNGDGEFTDDFDAFAPIVVAASTTPTAPPTVTVSASAASSSWPAGQDVTVSVTVASTIAGSPPPSGTVVVSDGSAVVAVLPAPSATASVALTGLSVGSHAIQVVFVPDDGSGEGTATLGLSVYVINTAATASLSATTGSVTDTSTLSVTVSSATGTPVGSVDLYVDGAISTSGAIDGAGAVSFPVGQLPAGSHTLTAVYLGYGEYQPSTASVVYTVTNSPPTASPYSSTTPAGSTVEGDLYNNASDDDGDALTFARGTAPAHGSATVAADGWFTYTPAAGFTGSDSFTYVASDGRGGTATATVTVTVNPAAGAQWASSVLGYSSQYSSSSWAASQALGAPNTSSYGDVSTAWAPLPKNGSLEYLSVGFSTPTAASGIVVRETYGNGFVFRIDLLDTADLWHTVWTGTDPSLPGSPVNFLVSFPVTAYLVKGAKVYVDTNHNTATWEEIDAVQLVGHANQSPVAVNDTVQTAVLGNILANDSDPDGDTITVIGHSNPAHGTLHIAPSGWYAYTPVAGFVGTDSFTYTIADGQGGTATATVSVTVNAYQYPAGQWASSVLGYSSQYSTSTWAAAQALGAPDTTSYGDVSTAWAPLPKNGSQEYLSVGFATPVSATGVIIRETYGNGFVYQVDLLDTNDVWHTIWVGTDPSQPGAPADFLIQFAATSYLVKGVKIYVDTNHDLNAWEEIDAVRLLS